MFGRLAFARQQPLRDEKLPDKFILEEHIVEKLKEEEIVNDDEFAGTPVEVGNRNVVVAEDGTLYDV